MFCQVNIPASYFQIETPSWRAPMLQRVRRRLELDRSLPTDQAQLPQSMSRRILERFRPNLIQNWSSLCGSRFAQINVLILVTFIFVYWTTWTLAQTRKSTPEN